MHPEHDENLLLLAHGVLAGVPRWRTEWHVQHCSDCRRRLAQYRSISMAMAGTIRDSGMPHWIPQIPALLTSSQWLAFSTILLVVVLLATMISSFLRHKTAKPAHGGASTYSKCTPGLPSDKCR